MKRSLFAVLGVALLAAPSSAAANQEPSQTEETRELPPPKIPIREARTSKRSGAVSLMAGPYKPTDILAQSNDPLDVTFEDVYGKDSPIMAGAEWEWQPLHHKYIGNLGIGAGAMFYRNRGRALTEAGTLSKQTLTLMLIPATVNITYRMALFENQPIVPYGGAGIDYWYFSESKEGASSVTGAKKGWHWRAGGQILLDVFDPNSAGQLDKNWGINNTYLFGEYRSVKMTLGNDPGFDFSANTWFAGLLFEY